MSRTPARSLEEQYDKGEHIEDLRVSATRSLKAYFKKKRSVLGGRIPEAELLSEASQKTVLNTQFDDRCMNFIHDHCLGLLPVNPKYKDRTVPWRVHCLLRLLSNLRKHEVSKEFQPGFLLLYFKFCWGVEIPPPPLL